ncbi:MAG: hypothetical protein AAF959_25680 [Cyanobacteria bacterium P01_D01_bin.56]
MSSLISSIQQSLVCQSAKDYQDQITSIHQQLLNERFEYQSTVTKYIELVDTYYSTLLKNRCSLFSQTQPAVNFQFYDELVKHSMIAGSYQLLKTWGIETLVNTHVQAVLGRPKDYYIKAFMVKSTEKPATSKNYYLYLAHQFGETLID